MCYIDAICSLVSVFGAFKAFRYKNEMHEKIKDMDIKEYYIQFNLLSRDFVNSTRDRRWYMGIAPSNVINPLSNIVNDFGKISILITDEDLRARLANMMKDLHTRIQQYEYPSVQTKKYKDETTNLIVQISFALGAESAKRMMS